MNTNNLGFFSRSAGSWRRIIGLIAIVSGIFFIWQPFANAAGIDFWRNSDSSVRNEVSDMAMFGKKLSTSRPMQAYSAAELKPGSGPVVPSRLRIPSLQIDTSVETLGLHNGNMDVPNNIWNAGWLTSTPRPGDVGNAVLDGHKDSVEGVAVFWSLGNLAVGDRVYVSDRYGYELTFEVVEKQSYDLNKAPLSRIFGAASDKNLNLITCDGTFVPEQYTYDHRLVIYTRLVTN